MIGTMFTAHHGTSDKEGRPKVFTDDNPKRKLECADCHAAVESDLDEAFKWMQGHVRSWHGRELAFTKEQYRDLTVTTKMISDQMLYGLMLAC